MKKQIKILTLILVVATFFLSGCSNTKIEEINYEKFNTLISEKKDFILYIGSATCHNCTEFGPRFEKVVKENKIENVYYIDLDELNDDDKKNFNRTINVTGTPTVVFITKGEEKSSFNRINGNVSEEKIIKRLKANNYIK